ncbi:hypothetical protein ACI8AC_15220 [Geodermatophilus sp. SYSU D00758]
MHYGPDHAEADRLARQREDERRIARKLEDERLAHNREAQARLAANQWFCPVDGAPGHTPGSCRTCIQREQDEQNRLARERQERLAQQARQQADQYIDLGPSTSDTSSPETVHDEPHSASEAEARARARAVLREADSGASEAAREQFERDRKVYKDWLSLETWGQVHHAIELRVLDLFPGVYTADELNDFGNMRGIPRELTKAELASGTIDIRPEGTRMQLHNVAIRERWNRAYVDLLCALEERDVGPGDPVYAPLVRRFLEDARDAVDYTLGQFFTEAKDSSHQAEQSAPLQLSDVTWGRAEDAKAVWICPVDGSRNDQPGFCIACTARRQAEQGGQ